MGIGLKYLYCYTGYHQSFDVTSNVLLVTVIVMLNKNTLGVKNVQGQSEAVLQIGTYV